LNSDGRELREQSPEAEPMEQGERITVTKTFRLEKSAIDLLEQEAIDRGISTNSVLNDIILNNLKRERKLRPVKTAIVNTHMIRRLADSLAEDALVKIAEGNSNNALIRRIASDEGGTLTVQSVLETMKLIEDVSISSEGQKKFVILGHFAGEKWSVVQATFWKSLFRAAGANVDYSCDENAVIFCL